MAERAIYPDIRKAVKRIIGAGALPITDSKLNRAYFPFASSIRRYLFVPTLPPAKARMARVLELGCGAGQGCLVLKSKGYRNIMAVDKHPAAAALLKAEGVEFVHKPVEQFRPTQRFDLVVCCDILEHVRNPSELLARIATWLLPHGTLFIAGPIVQGIDKNPYHLHAWALGEFRKLICNPQLPWSIIRESQMGVNWFDSKRYWAVLKMVNPGRELCQPTQQ